MQVTLTWLDYLILLTYTAFVVGIGFALKKYMRSSSDFLTSGRSIPTWVTGLAFISANLGALELVGMAASGAKYGISTAHFYWVGAIPAMIFLAVFMMPFYYGSKARSVPEYLKMRFDERVRALNSTAFAVMTVFASGISMNALAKLLHLLLGWNYHASLWICSAIVLVYVLKGGLTSAIYTEVLQFFMIVLGFAPVVYLGLKDVGGYSKLTEMLRGVATNPSSLNLRPEGIHYGPGAWTHAWSTLLAGPANNPMGVDWFAMVFGLGFVLSFGYWCTNFLVVQRAMAARNMTAARNTPLVAAVPKMLFPALVILPGMIAVALMTVPSKGYRIPAPILDNAVFARTLTVVVADASAPADQAFKDVSAAVGKKMDPEKVATLIKDYAAAPMAEDTFRDRLWNAVAEYDYDGVILSLVKRYCPPGLLGLALTGLLASFMSGMAGNVTAFNTVWTYDLYQAYFAPNRSDEHYMKMARAITVVLRGALQQRDGHHPARVRVRERPALRDVPARDVLGPHDRDRSLHRSPGRHRDFRTCPRAHDLHGQRPGHEGRLPRGSPYVPERDGPELLAGDLRLPGLLRPDGRHLACDEEDQDRPGAHGPCLFPHAQDQGGGHPLHPAPRRHRRGSPGRMRRSKPNLLVKGKPLWDSIFAGQSASCSRSSASS